MVGSYKIFEIGCNVAKLEKYPQIELRLSIIIMIMHNGLKISANVIFEKMKSFYPPVLQLEPVGPLSAPPQQDFSRKFDFRLMKII